MIVECPRCGHLSECIYRCENCQRDLVDEPNHHEGYNAA